MKHEKTHNNHGYEPHSASIRERPAAAGGKHHDAGAEKHGDVRGVQEGGSRAEARGTPGEPGGHVGHTHLKHATHELHRQHPHHHSAGGIHGTKDHHRHEPMHGLKPHHRGR